MSTGLVRILLLAAAVAAAGPGALWAQQNIAAGTAPRRPAGPLQWALDLSSRARRVSHQEQLAQATEPAAPAKDESEPPAATKTEQASESEPTIHALDEPQDQPPPLVQPQDKPAEPIPGDMPENTKKQPMPPVKKRPNGAGKSKDEDVESLLNPDEPLTKPRTEPAPPANGGIEPVAQPPGEEQWVNDEPAPTISSGTWLHRGQWYSQTEFSYLNRRADNVVGVAITSLTQTEVAGAEPGTDNEFFSNFDGGRLNTRQGLGSEPGARLTLGTILGRDDKNRDWAVEFTFFGLHEWEGDGLLDGNGFPVDTLIDRHFRQQVRDSANPTPDPTDDDRVAVATLVPFVPGFSATQMQSFTYRSDFDSYELNLRISQRLGRDMMELQRDGTWLRKCTAGPTSALLIGLRAVTVDERFIYQSIGPFQDNQPVRQGLYDVHTHNDLFGMQFGAECMYQNCRWRYGVRVKGGGYVNFADQSSHVFQFDATLPDDDGNPFQATRDETVTADVGAFLGDINLITEYYLRPNVALRFGYDFMWINQVALGPEQLSFNPSKANRIVTGGALFYQGASFGLEMVW